MTQESPKSTPSPNKADMRKHIEFIAQGMGDYQDGKIEIAYGDENNDPKLGQKFTVDEPWSIDGIIEFAAKKSIEGRNVYITGSYLSPDAPEIGRGSDKDFYATSSIWVDIDNDGKDGKPIITANELKIKYAHCRPHMVIVTGRKPSLRIWLWWKLLEPITDKMVLEDILTGIIQNLDGDKAAKNPSRLTRLGGSIAWATGKKAKEGRITEIVETAVTNEPPISVERLMSAYPIRQPQIRPKVKLTGLNLSTFDNPPEAEIRDMLGVLDAGMDRRGWLEIGMALHDAGYDFSLWNDWSARSKEKYDYDTCVKDWNSFKAGGGISLGTFIQKARDAGWMRTTDAPEPPRQTVTAAPEPPRQTVTAAPEPPHPTGIAAPKFKFHGLIDDTVNDMLATAQFPQRELFTLNVLAALGAVYGRRYASPMDTRTNLYTVGVASTGSGKDHSRKYIKTVLLKSGLKTFLGDDSLVSGAGLIASVAKAPSQIMHLDEFGMLLADIKNRNSASHMKICAKILTEFYSASNGVYYGGQYADPTRPPVRITAPNLCVYGTTTLSKYIEALDKSVIESGELNRYIIIKPTVDYPERVAGIKRFKPSQEIIDAWALLCPTFGANNPSDDTPPIPVTWDWLEQRIWDIQKFQDEMVRNGGSVGALWVRYAENVIKVAMIAAITRNQQKPNIEGFDLDGAESLVRLSVENMITLANDHMYNSTHEKDCNRILDVLKKHGKKMTKGVLSDKTRDIDQRARDSVLLALEERGAILIEKSEKLNGRPTYFISSL